MDDQKALAIISALANGVDPLTGEVFAPSSPYQSPEIVRALFIAARALQAPTQPTTPAGSGTRERSRAGAPGNVGKPWSREDEQRLLADFDRGAKPAELARLLGRTLAGVEARLEKHGRLAPQQRVTVNRYVKSSPQEDASTSRRV